MNNQDRAYYKPHYFRVNLPFRAKEHIEDYNDMHFARFIHEYIHFIQNLHTPWGLYTSARAYERMAYVFGELQQCNLNKISIPYKSNLSDNIIKNERICSIGNGNSKTNSGIAIDGLEIKRETPIGWSRKMIKVNDICLPLIEIEVETIAYGMQTVYLGAWIIKESMAQIVQDKFYAPDPNRNFVLPYDFVTCYCEHHAPSVAKDFDKQITICWASLFSMSPGKEFLDLIDLAERNPLLSAADLFSRYIKNSRITINPNISLTFETFMKDIRGRFIKCLELFVNQQCAYFTYILSNRSINNIYNSILKIYHSERARISETMQALGEPAIWGTENTSCFTFLKNNETSQVPTFKLFAYELVNEFLGAQDGKCPLKELCDQDKNIQKKYECVSNPLMIDNHCPMYFASRMVGINNKEICASDDSNR